MKENRKQNKTKKKLKNIKGDDLKMKKKFLLICVIAMTIIGLSVAPSTVFGEYSDPGDPNDAGDPDPCYDFDLEVNIWETNGDHNFQQCSWINWEATIINHGPDVAPDVTGEFSIEIGIVGSDGQEICVSISYPENSGNPGGSDLSPNGPGLYDSGRFEATVDRGVYYLKYTAYSRGMYVDSDTWRINIW